MDEELLLKARTLFWAIAATGITGFLYLFMYFTAFMLAFGNPSMTSRNLLDAFAAIHSTCNPLITLPLIFIITFILKAKSSRPEIQD